MFNIINVLMPSIFKINQFKVIHSCSLLNWLYILCILSIYTIYTVDIQSYDSLCHLNRISCSDGLLCLLSHWLLSRYDHIYHYGISLHGVLKIFYCSHHKRQYISFIKKKEKTTQQQLIKKKTSHCSQNKFALWASLVSTDMSYLSL